MITPQTIRKRCYKNFSVLNFLTDIRYSNINTSVTTHGTIDGAAEAFRNEFLAILNHNAPIKTIQIRKKYCPYLSEETKNLKAEREVLQKEASESKDNLLMEEFKIKSKEVKKAVTKDKKIGQEKDLGESSSITMAWKTARNIMGTTKSSAPTAIKGKDGELVTNPKKLAEMFNTFFLEKVSLLRAKTDKPPKILPTARLQQWLDKSGKCPPPFSLKPINRQKLRKLIKRMKGGKSCGIDTIDSYSLKLAAPLIEEALEHLINLSITLGKFSSFWKPQLVFPLHKKSDKDAIENYRPVSHLVEIGKLVEYAVYDQVTEHFTTHDLFHGNHHGGLPNHSTTTALVQLHDMFLQAAESKKLTGALLLDQSAAYDLLDHPILLKKLAVYNFDGNTIQWFQSYLSGRSQAVQVEAQQSSLHDLQDHGAPQGSILGGLLFIINSNDFPACRVEGESVLFVDDDTDCVSEADPDCLVQKMQLEADNSCDWLGDNRMCVAGDKSKFMVVGTKELRRKKCENRELSIIVDGKVIKETSSEKLLGVIMNNKMTWRDHLHGETWRSDEKNQPGIIPQLSQRVGILRKISAVASKKKLRMIAQGIFYSKLSYCLPLFSNTWGLDHYKDGDTRSSSFTKEDNRKLQVLQNQVARLMLYKKDLKGKLNFPTKELLELSQDLSIHQLGALRTVTLAKKIMLCKKPNYLTERLKMSQTRATRSGTTLAGEKTSLGMAREGFIYRGTKLFNLMPDALKNEKKMNIFKKNAKSWAKENIPVKP